MSETVGTLKNTGSRKVDMIISSYYGGKEAGECVQLSATQEDGTYGYVQLTRKNLRALFYIVQSYIYEEEMGILDFITTEEETKKEEVEKYYLKWNPNNQTVKELGL